MNHPGEPLVASAQCKGFFLFVKPYYVERTKLWF
jgi:hypothetical protein